MDKKYDMLERRCPRLGGTVNFGYCRNCGDNEPVCYKVFDCWWESFDVHLYFKNNLDEQRFNNLLKAKPKPKPTSLIELIQKAKRSLS